MTEPLTRLKPGDVVVIDTDAGPRHVQVTHLRAPYPDVIRAIRPAPDADSPETIARAETAFLAMVELAGALRDTATRVVGHATIPADCRPFPIFRMPIRDKAGAVVYWWTWDGEGLTVAPEAGDSEMPIREILPVAALRQRLAAL